MKEKDTLPHFRKTVKIKFSSLRTWIGPNLGVVFDCDEMVVREAYRKKTEDGWKWQIRAFNKISIHDYSVLVDQEILDDGGQDIDVEIID